MGILDFFKKKSKETTNIIKFKNINDWLEQYTEEQELNKKLEEFKKKINTLRKEAKELMKNLENASLMNENIPERVKQIMQGNRRSYLLKTNNFLDNIEFPRNYFEMEEFSKNITKQLDELSKETQKSHLVLKEFLETELAAVIRKIKEIEIETKKEEKNLEEQKISNIQKIKELLSQLKNSEKALKELKEEQKKQKKEQTELKEETEKIHNNIQEIRKSTEYTQQQKLKQKKTETENNIKTKQNEIIQHFSTIEKALRKYEHISLKQEIIKSYLNNPTEALIKDNNIEIADILIQMEKSISQLGLKDKKEEKTKEEIKKLTKEFLKEKKEALEKIRKEQQEIKSKILASTIKKEIEEQEQKLEENQQKIKQKQIEITETKQKIERNKPEKIKEQIKEELKRFQVIIKDE